jgi:hypothetical protein
MEKEQQLITKRLFEISSIIDFWSSYGDSETREKTKAIKELITSILIFGEYTPYNELKSMVLLFCNAINSFGPCLNKKYRSSLSLEELKASTEINFKILKVKLKGIFPPKEIIFLS